MLHRALQRVPKLLLTNDNISASSKLSRRKNDSLEVWTSMLLSFNSINQAEAVVGIPSFANNLDFPAWSSAGQ